MLDNIFYNFLGGIIAAFSPCTIVLIPLVLYRFFNKEEKHIKKFLIFIGGFLIAYLIFALILKNIISSSISNGFKIGFGILILVIGLLSLLKKINPLKFPAVKSPIILGFIFAGILSTSPCTIPYLGIIISLSGLNVITNLLAFSLGLLTPAISFAIIGQSTINLSKKTGKIYDSTKRLMDILLIGTGIYLIFSITSITKPDIFFAIALLGLSFLITIKAFFITGQKLKITQIFLALSLLGIIIATTIQCNYLLDTQKEPFNFLENTKMQKDTIPQNSCQDIEKCDICKKCSITFMVSALIGFITIYLSKISKKKSNQKHQSKHY